MSHFVDSYHQLPEEFLLKWIVRVTNCVAVSLVLYVAEWKSMFGLTDTGPTAQYGTILDGYT